MCNGNQEGIDSRDITGVEYRGFVDQSDVRRKMEGQLDDDNREVSDRQDSPEMELFPSGK